MRRYHLTTTEALEGGKRVKVCSEGGKVLWEKTRELDDEEVVDTMFDSSHQPRWTLHRPLHGWYLILRSPCLPPTSYIALHPSPSGSGGLGFHVRSVLSLPPSTSDALSPSSEKGEDEVRMSFSAAGDSTPTVGSFAEAQGAPSTSQASTSRFTLRPTTPLGHHGVLSLGGLKGLIAGKGKTFCCVWEGPPEVLKLGGAELGPSGSGVVEVFRFEEGVSLLSTTTRGTLYLSEPRIEASGMEPSFWVALALGYLEFLEEKDAYGWAKEGD